MENREQTLPKDIEKWKVGWYFVRIYDTNDDPIESLDFRFASGLKGVNVSSHTFLPGSDGHLPVLVEFIHEPGWVVQCADSNANSLNFEFEDENELEKFDQNSFINFLIVRGISLPSLRYDNQTSSLDIYEGKLSAAVHHHQKILQQQENVQTGLMVGPEDCWQFSVLIFICSQIIKHTDQDIQRLLDEYHKKKDI